MPTTYERKIFETEICGEVFILSRLSERLWAAIKSSSVVSVFIQLKLLLQKNTPPTNWKQRKECSFDVLYLSSTSVSFKTKNKRCSRSNFITHRSFIILHFAKILLYWFVMKKNTQKRSFPNKCPPRPLQSSQWKDPVHEYISILDHPWQSSHLCSVFLFQDTISIRRSY